MGCFCLEIIAFCSCCMMFSFRSSYIFRFDLWQYLFLGVEIYCAPTADSREVWQASMTHIALEGGCFVLSANQFCRRKDYPPPPEYFFSGTEQDLTPDSVVCAGGSVIISPSGTVLAGPNYDGEALISADLGMSLLSTICTFLNFQGLS